MRVLAKRSPLDDLLDDLASRARDLHDEARRFMRQSSEYLKEAEQARPYREIVGDIYFDAGMALKREADALGALIERYGKGRGVQKVQPPARS